MKSLALKLQVLKNCPVLGSSTALFVELFKFCRSPEKFETIFFGDRLKKNFEDLFFWIALALVPLVLGLKHFCSWPRKGLSSEGLSLASNFFGVLGLEPCVLDSTSDGKHNESLRRLFFIYKKMDDSPLKITLSSSDQHLLKENNSNFTLFCRSSLAQQRGIRLLKIKDHVENNSRLGTHAFLQLKKRTCYERIKKKKKF